ncbi:MAG: hypothetical protein HZY74_00350 [Brevundimonas sp.]|nr:MAG: hypothetical protein HZY74_00350 [Brevundimonas sp.]
MTNGWLTLAGSLSAAAALAHIGVIFGGANWYRTFGAGERMARAAERGDAYPAVITIGIAAILAVWAAYAFSGAGLLPKLPLLKPALIAITSVYLLRAITYVPLLNMNGIPVGRFAWVSSAIVLVLGSVYLAGVLTAWPH